MFKRNHLFELKIDCTSIYIGQTRRNCDAKKGKVQDHL